MSNEPDEDASRTAERLRHAQLAAEGEARESWMKLDIEGVREAERRARTASAAAHHREYVEQRREIARASRVLVPIHSRTGRDVEVPVPAETARTVLAADGDGELQVRRRGTDALIVQRYSRSQAAVERSLATPIAGGAQMPDERAREHGIVSMTGRLQRCQACRRPGPWSERRRVAYEAEALFCRQCAGLLDTGDEGNGNQVEEHAALTVACDLRVTRLIAHVDDVVAAAFDKQILGPAVARQMKDWLYGSSFKERSAVTGRYRLNNAARERIAARARRWLDQFVELAGGRVGTGKARDESRATGEQSG